MKLANKNYQRIKIKKYLKKNKLFFFFYSVGRNSNEWKKVEQDLKSMKLNSFKTFNKITNKKLKNSIYKNMKEITKGSTFFVKLVLDIIRLMKNLLLTKLHFLFFLLIAIKINNKIYPTIVLKKMPELIAYVVVNLLFYQFSLANLKYNIKFFKNGYSK